MMEQVASSMKGMEHAVQTQLRRQEEESDQTKILGYKVEQKLGVFFARGFNRFVVVLCPGVEGKELFRRLEDEAAFGGPDRVKQGLSAIRAPMPA